MISNCIIINLDSRNDLWNNLQEFREKWSKQGKTLKRMPGVDYKNKKHVLNDFIIQGRINLSGNGFRNSLTPFLGELGCYMGHYDSWKYVVDNHLDYCLILEDGIKWVRDDFQNLAINNGIDTDLDIVYVNEEMNMNNHKQFIGYGLQGYIVSQKGAQALLQHCNTLSAPIDLQIRHLCNTGTIKANIIDKPFVKRDNNRISSIQGIKLDDEHNLNDKQNPSSIIERIIINLINKNINLDEFV